LFHRQRAAVHNARIRSGTQQARQGNGRSQCQNRASRRYGLRTEFCPRGIMAISVVMPALELTQETGKLVSWRKKEGEAVAKGETLLEVETDKAVVEVEALADGYLAGVKAKEGDVIAVGRTIAWIVDKGEPAPADEAPAAVAAANDVSRAACAAESAAPS